MAPRNAGRAQTIDVIIDSGAGEVAAPTRFAIEYPLKPSAGLRNGARYRIASGAIIANRGEKRADVSIDGQVRMMAFQLADVTNYLRRPDESWRRATMSFSAIVELTPRTQTGRSVNLHKKNNTLVKRVQNMPKNRTVNSRESVMDVDFLGESGFAWQEDGFHRRTSQ